MQDVAEHALVMKALTSGLSNCVCWLNDKQIRIFRKNLQCEGLTHQKVIDELVEYVLDGGPVAQVSETRPEYSHRRFYYKAIVPVDAISSGLFVEMELEENPDPEVPLVWVLNAHPQR